MYDCSHNSTDYYLDRRSELGHFLRSTKWHRHIQRVQEIPAYAHDATKAQKGFISQNGSNYGFVSSWPYHLFTSHKTNLQDGLYWSPLHIPSFVWSSKTFSPKRKQSYRRNNKNSIQVRVLNNLIYQRVLYWSSGFHNKEFSTVNRKSTDCIIGLSGEDVRTHNKSVLKCFHSVQYRWSTWL